MLKRSGCEEEPACLPPYHYHSYQVRYYRVSFSIPFLLPLPFIPGKYYRVGISIPFLLPLPFIPGEVLQG